MLIKITHFISDYILPVGFFFFLSGILFFSSFSAYHTQIYIFLIAPALLLILLNHRNYSLIFSSHAFILLILFLSYALFSLLWNSPEVEDIKSFKEILIIYLFIIAIITIAQNNTKKLILLLLISSLLYSVTAYYNLFQDYIIAQKPFSMRIIGVGNLSNPLLSSHLYGIFSVFTIAYFFTQARNLKSDLLLLFIFTGLILFTFFTGSRTPLVGIIVVLIFLMWERKDKWLAYLLAIILTLFAIYLFFTFDSFIKRGFSYRPETWSISIQHSLQSPILGHGLGTEISVYLASLNKDFHDSHNIHIGTFYQFGLIGLVLWFLLIIYAFKIYLKNRDFRLAQIGVCLLLYGMASGMTEATSFLTRPKEIWFLTWLPLSLLLSVEFIRLKEQAYKS